VIQLPAESTPLGAAVPRRNRLAIAHLLLWTAATGLVLLYFQSRRLPPQDSIGFASFLTQRGTDVKAKMAADRQRIWRSWHRGCLVGLAFAPIYGAALAGLGLGIGRTVTGRFGFPAQPGHWLLLEIGGITAIVASRHLLRSLPLSADGEDFVVACLMLVVASAAALAVGYSPWRLPMAAAACGLAVICLAYGISLRSQSIESPGLYGVGLLVIALVPLLALLAVVLDLADRRRYDIFHWFGVAAFLGVLGHFLALIGVTQF
jgi:hypothetical protein